MGFEKLHPEMHMEVKKVKRAFFKIFYGLLERFFLHM